MRYLQDWLADWVQRRGATKGSVKRSYSARYHTDRQTLRWGQDQHVVVRTGEGVQARRGLARLGPRSHSWPRDRRKIVFYILPLIIGLGSATAVFVIQPSRPKPPPVAESVKLPDPLAGVPDPVKQELLAPEVRVPATLKLTFTGKPEELCQELAVLGLENNGWRRAPLSHDRWQCASELAVLTTPSVDYGPSTLFFLLRGPDAETVDYLRLKLNVEDPKQVDIGQEAVRLVIGALSDRYAWAVPQKVLDAIAHFKPLEMTDRGVRLSVAPEDPVLTGDPTASRRLNIVLDFGKPDLIRSAKEFEPLPRKRRELTLPEAE